MKFSTPLMILAAMGCSAFAFGQTTVRELGEGTLLLDLTEDASAGVGVTFENVFHWTTENGAMVIGGTGTGAPRISRNGQRIIGTAKNPVTNTEEMSYYDVPTSTWRHLGSLGTDIDGTSSVAWGLSDDGTVISGSAWIPGASTHAVVWTEATGLIDLGTIEEGFVARADQLSGNGQVMYGRQDTSFGSGAGRWTWNPFSASLLMDGDAPAGNPLSTNFDGTIVTGMGHPTVFDSGYIWQEGVGFTPIETPAGFFFTNFVNDTDETASRAVGYASAGFNRQGYIWERGRGTMGFEDYLRERGLTIPDDWSFTVPTVITKDGRYIGGWGFLVQGFSGFIVDLGVRPISGTVAIPGLTISLAGLPITVELYASGTSDLVRTYATTLAADGTFSLQTTYVGAYDIAVKRPNTLRQAATDLSIDDTDGKTGLSFSLTLGDIDGDNSVTVFDYDVLSQAFDSRVGDSGFIPEADLDGDGTVTVFDYDLLSQNFDQNGDK